ncbi:MAG TPA: tetratricopeptide repeat protein [Ginsengibacter sp.]
MKQLFLLSSFIFLGNTLFAQSIDDGKKFLDYEKYTSAQNVFSKLVAANPNDIEAVYWLGQTYIKNDENPDTAAAKALYQKALQANPNTPLLMVGMGEIALMEGQKADARNKFEAAMSIPKKKELPEIQEAVGRANVDTKSGDPVYAIGLLNQAADKDKKNSEVQILLGDAYRKMIDGANATTSYTNALAIDPKSARADFMIGRIFETQGYGQEPIYMKYYDAAIAADPNFAPVYYWLYNYYYERDVNKSRDYLNKYIAVADPDSKNCYAEASLLYVSKLYQQAIAKSDECITTGGTKVYPNVYGLKAYSYDKLGDSINAKKYFEEFFAKVNPDKIGPNDYATYGKVLLKIPAKDSLDKVHNDSLASLYIDKAVALDTVPANKLDYLKSTAESLIASKNYADAGKWYTKILKLKPEYGKVDLYYAGYNDYRGGAYTAADSIFGLYTQKYPEDIFGWYMKAHADEGIDSTGINGLAKPSYEKVIAIADTSADKDKVKANAITGYRYMVAYYYNVKHNKDSAIYFNSKILELDPNDTQAQTNDKALRALPSQPSQPAKASKEGASPAKK